MIDLIVAIGAVSLVVSVFIGIWAVFVGQVL